MHELFEAQVECTPLLRVSVRARMDELIAGLQAVIDRHDALCTAILWEELPQPVQAVHRGARLLADLRPGPQRLRNRVRIEQDHSKPTGQTGV